MAATKTKPADDGVEAFLATLDDPRRVEESRTLIEMLGRVTGHQPVLWGPSMIGFDQYHYRYASGHEGDSFKVGFSPRKAKLSLYGIGRDDGHMERLGRLGKHALAKGCVYVNKLTDVDLEVLEDLFRYSYEHFTAPEA